MRNDVKHLATNGRFPCYAAQILRCAQDDKIRKVCNYSNLGVIEHGEAECICG